MSAFGAKRTWMGVDLSARVVHEPDRTERGLKFPGLPFMVLHELCEQLRNLLRLLLLHPMAGVVHQMKAHHLGARGLLHALGGARELVCPPVALAPDEHGRHIDGAA